MLNGCRINLVKILFAQDGKFTLVVRHSQFVDSLPWDIKKWKQIEEGFPQLSP